MTKEEFVKVIEDMNSLELKEFIDILEEKLFAKKEKDEPQEEI